MRNVIQLIFSVTHFNLRATSLHVQNHVLKKRKVDHFPQDLKM